MKTFLLALPLLAMMMLVPAGTAQAADRSPPVANTIGHHHHYAVYYRECSHSRWVRYNTYDCPIQARKTVRWLEYQGYETTTRTIHHD